MSAEPGARGGSPTSPPGLARRILTRMARVDRFTLGIMSMVLLASRLPAQGAFARALDPATALAVALTFFLHGAKLSRQDIVRGIGHWRLHLWVLGSTYAIFPLLALGITFGLGDLLTPELRTGVLFLSALPSTVQSSITFTAIAGGNVAAAVCSASLSNLGGVLFTPLLVAGLIRAEGGVPLGAALFKIGTQILLPFVVGHFARPLLAEHIARRRDLVGRVDRGAIMLIVYTAFSASVVEGLWQRVSPGTLGLVALVGVALVATMLVITRNLAKQLGFSRADEITMVFCGTKKSMVSGLPMAKVLFAGAPALGALVLPLMVYHQAQLLACSFIAGRYARGNPLPDQPAPSVAPAT